MANKQATDTELFLETVADQFPLAVVAWNHSGQVQTWNKSATQLFGYSADDALNYTLVELFGVQAHQLLATLSRHSSAQLISENGTENNRVTRWKLLTANMHQDACALNAAVIEDISEQFELQRQHRIAVQSLEEVTLHMNDFTYSHDLSGHFININETAANEFGYSSEEFLRLNIKDIVVADYHESVSKTLQNKLSGVNESSHYEIEVKKKNGDTFWIEVSNRLIIIDGHPVGVQGIAHNIDVRKQYEIELRKNEEKFRGIFETIDDIYFYLNIDGTFDLVSPSAFNHLGYMTDELMRMEINHLYASQESGDVLINELLDLGYINDYEIELKPKTGDSIPFSVSAHIIFDAEGLAKGIEGIARNISQRKDHEKILETKEQRFRRIFESIQDVYFRTENDSIQFISPSCERLLGYTPEEMIGHNAQQFYARSDARTELLATFSKQGYLTDYEIDYVHKNGESITCSLNLNAVRDNNIIVAFEGTLRDITARKRTEQALRDSEHRFRRIFESFQDTYYEADMNGILTALSPSVESHYGYHPDELIGKPAISVYANPAQREDLFEILSKHGFVNDFELMLINKAGEVRPASCSTRLVFNEHNQPVAVQGVLRDITERKKSEADLRNSEARYRSIFNSIPDAFLEINSFGTIVNASPSVAQFHYHPKKIIGSNISGLFVNKHDWINIKNWLHAHNDIQDQESMLIKNNDEPVPVSITAYKIDNNNDNSMGNSICIIRDISDNKHYEQELELTRDQALEASRAKSSFLANMSHELRTPLNAIIGYSEMLAEEAADEGREQMHTDLIKIQSSGKHLLSVISDILDLSKIEAGKLELNIEEYSIKDLVNEILVTITPLAQLNRNELACLCSLEQDKIQTDIMRLKQALFNLLSNACKFTSDGAVTLEIYSHHDDQKDWIYFKVSDTGIGITEEQMKKLFNEFTQADSTTTRKYGGTGLGLVISQRFCQLLGGDINASSTHGVGSSFIIKLPQKSLALNPLAGQDQKSALI